MFGSASTRNWVVYLLLLFGSSTRNRVYFVFLGSALADHSELARLTVARATGGTTAYFLLVFSELARLTVARADGGTTAFYLALILMCSSIFYRPDLTANYPPMPGAAPLSAFLA